MEWLNLKTSTLNAPEYVGCEPRARATWISVILWCALQENGGRVSGAIRWKDRQWQQTCGVSLREVNSAEPLLSWDSDDLVVWNYPRDKQEVVVTKREIARLGGLASARARAENARQAALQANGSTENEPNAPSDGSSERSNGMEGKGKEGNGTAGARGGIPDSLNTPAFVEAWQRWLMHWSTTFNHSNPMPETTAHQHLRILSAMGPARAIAAIENSIARGNFRKPEEPFAPRGDSRPEAAVTTI